MSTKPRHRFERAAATIGAGRRCHAPGHGDTLPDDEILAPLRGIPRRPRPSTARAGRSAGAGTACSAPRCHEEYGGSGGTYAHETGIIEGRSAMSAWMVSASRCTIPSWRPNMRPPLRVGEQEADNRLPKMATGELIGAIAMTEPGAGSRPARGQKTRAVRDGNQYSINGSKTFITNGQLPISSSS